MDLGHCVLEGNVDAVEFCPHESFHNVLAASTYVLQEGDPPSRSGCITLFDIDADADSDSGHLKSIQKVETAGIFDIKWSPVHLQGPARPLLAQADADGCVKIYSLQNSDSNGSETRGIWLNEVDQKCISTSMCLCIDWDSWGTSLAVGHSDGSVSVTSLREAQLSSVQEWKAHEFEVWAASFDIQQPKLLYTGSDDCRFSCWDLRDEHSKPVFQNTKTHKMGICCIAKSPLDSNCLLTGCYDEWLRVWDVRSISKPVKEIGLGGGVWRIKHHPYVRGFVLAACMHNGFGIVRIEGGDGMEVVERYEKHDSLAYGADWKRGKGSDVIATCSFYDRLVRVWKPKGGVFV